MDYATSDGTATAGQDYTSTSGTLTLPANSTESLTISVPVTDDTIDGDEETFTLTLSQAVTAALAGGGTTLAVTGTLTDNDDPQVTVSLGADPERTVTIPLTAANQDGATAADYSGVPASVEFESGETSQSFTFTAAADDVDDDGEGVKLAFGTLPAGISAGSTATSTVTITDDDTAGVDIDPTALTVLEGQSNTYTVKLTTEPSSNVTVTISGHSGTDINPSGSTLTFTTADWSQAQTMTLTAGDVAVDTDVTLSHAVAPAGHGSVSAADVVDTVVDVPSNKVTIQVGVTVTGQTLSVPEGGNNTYEPVLAQQPTGDVTVTVS